jgi:F-type H+-transporting ATPase subunit gamma
MAQLQAIKRRTRTVGNIRQITKAMQLVAASKLRRAQQAALGPKDYTLAARELLAKLSGSAAATRHPLYQVRPVVRALTVVVAGERGMAGAYNANILKSLISHAREQAVPQSAICIGKYAAGHVARFADMDEMAAYDIELADADVNIAQPVLEEIIELYSSHDIDAVHLIYTRFVSSVRQEAVIEQLLPIVPPEQRPVETTLEPNPERLIEFATRRLLEAQILQAVLEARASEQAARMLAMMNASDNANDLIDDLTLAYNNARQAVITQELAEITGGAEAMSK